MTKKILSGGMVLLVGVALVFTVWAQTPPENTEETQPTEQQESMQSERIPFHQILAEKLGIDVETLQSAMEEAKDEFQAQLPERAQRQFQNRGAGNAKENFQGGPGQRQGRFQGQGGPGANFGGRGSVMGKTTVIHEYYHTGGFQPGFQQQYQQNNSPRRGR